MKKIRSRDDRVPGQRYKFMVNMRGQRDFRIIKNCPVNRITKIKYPNKAFVWIPRGG